MKRLADRIVLVTGAARGLGKEIAARCAQEGARLILADVLQADGETTARELAAAGAEATFHRCDITSRDDLATLAQAIQARWGRLDGLVNNAALATRLAGRAFDQLDEESWDRVFDINVKGTWMVTKAVASLLRAGQNARVVNLSSDTAIWGGDLFLHYVASKGAIVSMTRGLARELGRDGVCVNAIAPGLVETEATASAPDRRWQQYRTGQLIDRRATPKDIAGVAAFLLSVDASHITGQVIAVNAGMTLG
jgi:NAD(P)-dependent dehydrogenase (short-subunit alcohol dehydrogenase family)